MPSLTDYDLVAAQLTSDCIATGAKKVYFQVPTMPPKVGEIPFAVCILQSSTGSFELVTRIHEEWLWEITVVYHRPNASVNPHRDKLEKAQALRRLLESRTEYAGVGMLPIVQDLDFEDRADIPSGTTSFSMGFRMRVERDWGE